MRTLGLALLTVMAVGCHFGKLFNDSSGEGTPPGGAPPAATHVIFATQPSSTSARSTISPPVRVAAMDDQGGIATFPDLSIDQPSVTSAYTLQTQSGQFGVVESASFTVGP